MLRVGDKINIINGLDAGKGAVVIECDDVRIFRLEKRTGNDEIIDVVKYDKEEIGIAIESGSEVR